MEVAKFQVSIPASQPLSVSRNWDTVLGCQAGSQPQHWVRWGPSNLRVLILRFVTPEGSELGFRVSNVGGGLCSRGMSHDFDQVL